MQDNSYEVLNQPPEHVEVAQMRTGFIDAAVSGVDYAIERAHPSEKPVLSIIPGGGEQTPRTTDHLRVVGNERTIVQPETVNTPQLEAAHKAIDEARAA